MTRQRAVKLRRQPLVGLEPAIHAANNEPAAKFTAAASLRLTTMDDGR